eukprot:3395532-Alexandrium_andersonii.AAC.1
MSADPVASRWLPAGARIGQGAPTCDRRVTCLQGTSDRALVHACSASYWAVDAHACLDALHGCLGARCSPPA